jgi:hypothetical protein
MATFSITDRATYKQCRQKWDFSSNSRSNLTMVGSGPEPLELGSLIHRALADWIIDYTSEEHTIQLASKQENYLAGLFLKHAAARQQEVTQAFEERTRRKINPVDLESLHNVVQLGTAMMRNYQEHHKSPFPPHMSFAMPEQEILIPVPGTEHQCENCFGTGLVPDHKVSNGPTYVTKCINCNGKGKAYHHVSATLDGLLQDKNDRLYVLEHKTYGNRPNPLDLSMNDQFIGYAWVVRQLNIGRVAGIAYDGMWKRDKPPKYMQKEKRAGTMNDLFIRTTIQKTSAALDAWGRNLTLEINEMANNPVIYPHVPWQGCGGCQFIKPCLAKMNGEDFDGIINNEYTQRNIVRSGQSQTTTVQT